MSYRNLASVELPASFLTELTHDERLDKIALFLTKSKAQAEAEEIEEFWNEIKKEAKMWALADDLERAAKAAEEAKEAREAREAIEAIEAKQTKERQEFWDKIKREAKKNASTDKAKETKEEREARELREKEEFWRNIREEAADLALREERYNELKEKHIELIKHIHELSKKEPIDYSTRSYPHKYSANADADAIKYVNLAGYKRKSKHYKSKHYKSKHKHYKNNRRIKKTKKHVK